MVETARPVAPRRGLLGRLRAAGRAFAGTDPGHVLLDPGLAGSVQAAAERATRAEESARQAERGARAAQATAATTARTARAEQAALQSDGLLLDDEAQRLYAQVSLEQPFGIPTATGVRRGLLRGGFTVAVGVLLAVGLARAILAVSSELLLVVIAAFVAVGLDPVVDWLVHRGMRRGFAVALIGVTFVGLLAGFAAAAVPPIVGEAMQLIGRAPDYVQALQDKHTTIGRINATLHLEDRLRLLAAAQLSLDSVGGWLNAGRTLLSYTFQVLVTVVLVIYFLADFPAIKRAFYRLAPLPLRPRVGLLGDEILARTGGYVLGNLFTSIIAAIAQFAVLRFVGVPFALVLSVLVGVFDLIPLVGSTAANVVVVAVSLATVPTSGTVFLVGFAIVYRLFEDYVLSPRILKRTVDVKPAVTIISVLLGGALLGAEGALIAVPVAAAIQLLVTEIVYPRTDRAGAS